MPDVGSEFERLLLRARGGDKEALSQLVSQYEPKVRLVARMLLGPALRPYLDSVDLVQSVHKSLMIGLRQDKFDLANPENLLALALTLVRRKVARQWRRVRRQQRGSEDAATLAGVLTTLTHPQDDPARAAAFNDAVRHLCESLNDCDRRLLELRLSGCTQGEVAETLDLSPVAVRVRMTRLRQRLRAAGVLDDWM
jgi:RNA polymerase sigma-70 factor (ECF subfamily)